MMQKTRTKLRTAQAVLLLSGCLPGAEQQGDPATSAESPPSLMSGTTASTSEVTDTFTQSPSTVVDLLFIVDNSCSMWEEQMALVASAPAFMNPFIGSGLDYHIGVVSTDMNDPSHAGKLRQHDGHLYIDDQTPDPESVFSRMVALGVSGFWTEQGRDAGYSALVTHAQDANAGFLRPTSGLHVIVVSDNDDHSSLYTHDEWVAYLHDEQGVRPHTTLSGIVGLTDGPVISEVGTAYIEASNEVGGALWEISAVDLDPALEDIAAISSQPNLSFPLSSTPVLGTLRVEVLDDGVTFAFVEDLDWTYNASENSVVFLAFVPSPGATIQVHYAVVPDP